MQTTLILLKPDCVTKKNSGDVISRLEKEGFTLRGIKMITPSPAVFREHYSHIAAKPFYPDVEAFMRSAPVIALAVEGENVIDRVRALLGPTDSRKAVKGTIRGDFGVDNMINVVHASDSVESAAVELKRFFAEGELFAY